MGAFRLLASSETNLPCVMQDSGAKNAINLAIDAGRAVGDAAQASFAVNGEVVVGSLPAGMGLAAWGAAAANEMGIMIPIRVTTTPWVTLRRAIRAANECICRDIRFSLTRAESFLILPMRGWWNPRTKCHDANNS